MLASRFASRSPVLRSDSPLSDDQIRAVVPSIYAEAPHESRSERYCYIPTVAVLTELRKEGFQPFMVTQTRVRNDDRRDHTKHMIRLRHANQVNDSIANESTMVPAATRCWPGRFVLCAAMDWCAATPWPMYAFRTRAT